MNYYSLKLQNDSRINDMRRERNNTRLAKQAQPQKHTPARPRLVSLVLLLLGQI